MRMLKKRGFVRERIVRTLLNNPDGSLTKYRVSKLAMASYPWVHGFLKDLESGGMIEGTRVVNVRELVLLWRGFRIAPETREYMVKNPLEVLKSASMRYALTTYAAENLVQKYLFPSRTDFYIDPSDKARWHDTLSRKGLVGKGNVRMLIGDGHALYNSPEMEGYSTTSIPQLAVDLLAEGGPCAEAAEMLIEREEGRHVRRK